MFERLSPGDRRAVMIGAVILVPALLYVYAARPIARAIADKRAAAVQQTDLLARERAMIERSPRFPALRTEVSQRLDAERKHTITSEASVTANVKLADYVRQIGRAHEVLVTDAAETPGDSLTPGVMLLRLSVHGESDLRGILGFVRGIENGSMHARLASLQIEKARGRTTPNAQAEDPREILMLTATIEAPAVITAAKGAER
jgi:hypothetical protein